MAVAPSSPAESSSSSPPICSICWDDLTNDCGRSLVTLQCSHRFHLDCIGSTFNSFGAMRCPLCRATENGSWVIPGERVDDPASSEEDEPEPEPEFEEFECIDWDLFPLPEGLTARVLLCRVFPQNSQPPTLAAGNADRSPTLYHRYIRASDIIDELNQNWNQPLTPPFRSLPSHFIDGNHARVPSSTPSSSRNLSEGVVDNNSVLERFVIDPSNGLTYRNVDYMATSSNSPSPAVRAMMYGRSQSSGLSGTVPADNAARQSEQTQFSFSVPLNNTPAIQQHQQSPSIVQHEALETSNVAPSPFMREMVFGQNGSNDFPLPADNAARQSEQTQFLFNVPLNNTPAIQQHQQSPSIVQPESHETNNVAVSPFMRAMMIGQSRSNDCPRRVPADNAEQQSELSQFLFNMPLNNTPAIQRHQQSPSTVLPEAWETDNVAPSPFMHAIMIGQSGFNDFPRRVPAGNAAQQSEQTQFLFNELLNNTPAIHRHQESPSIVQLEAQETNNVAPSSFMRALMFGQSGTNGFPGRVPADFATLQSEQTDYFCNASLNSPNVWHHQESTSMVQPEAQERDIAPPPGNSPDDIDLTLKL
ncbi:hypothetical protein SLE2022_165820 [Rubroshorea leprosula]